MAGQRRHRPARLGNRQISTPLTASDRLTSISSPYAHPQHDRTVTPTPWRGEEVFDFARSLQPAFDSTSTVAQPGLPFYESMTSTTAEGNDGGLKTPFCGNYQKLIPQPDFVSADGEQPQSHGCVSLEDFLKPQRRPRGRQRSSQSNLRIDVERSSSDAMNSTLSDAQFPPLTARRLASPPSFPQTPARTVPRASLQAHPNTDPVLHDRTSSLAQKLPIQGANHGDIQQISDGYGQVIVFQFHAARNASECGRWCAIGAVSGDALNDLMAFDTGRDHYIKPNGEFDADQYQAHKAHAIQQMARDGQLCPVTSSPEETDSLATQSDFSGITQASATRTQEHIPQSATQAALRRQSLFARQARDYPQDDKTPTRSTYNPFTPADPFSALQQEQSANYDPFVSPYHSRFNHSASDWHRRMTANDIQNWNEQQTRRMTLQQSGRQAAMQDLQIKRDFGLRDQFQAQVSKAASELKTNKNDQVHRTVLRDPFAKPSIESSVALAGNKGLFGNGRQEQLTQIAQPKPRHSFSISGAQHLQDFCSSTPDSALLSSASTAYGPLDEQVSVVGSNPWADASQSGVRANQGGAPLVAPRNAGINQAYRQPPAQTQPLQSAPPDVRQYLDFNKTEEELRNPFGDRQLGGHPPFFMGDIAPNEVDCVEDRDARLDHFWNSGIKDFRQKMEKGANLARIGRIDVDKAPDADIPLLFLGPLLENVKFYHAAARDCNRYANLPANDWRSKMNKTDNKEYFAKMYDPYATLA